MGTNSSVFNRDAHYSEKTVKQLQEELKTFEASYANWEPFGSLNEPPAFYNEHIQYLRVKIAERILNK
jgi:hypothetical protein